MVLTGETQNANIDKRSNLNKNISLINGHVSEEQIAFYVDSLMANKSSAICSQISIHLDNCLQCKVNMLKLKNYYED